MSDSKAKGKSKNKAPVQEPPPQTVATKLDFAVAKYLRNNLPTKEAMFVGIKRVNYFIASKAVDVLMNSKYSDQFKTREEAVLLLNSLLLKRFFHRARKIIKVEGSKKKFKLDMHDIQTFEDCKEPYVWLYEPTSLRSWLFSIGLVLLVVAVCLFPLWPQMIRGGVYKLCIFCLCLLSALLGLSVVRHIIFFIVWALTIGKIHFWLLPNLTEDVGIWESFVPLYTIEINSKPTTEVKEGHQD